MKVIKESKMSLQQALKLIDKDEFEEIYHNPENTYLDMAKYFNISTSMVKSLASYWGISWSDDERSARKKFNATKVDYQTSISKRNQTNINKYGVANPRTVLYPDSYIYDDDKRARSNEKRRQTVKDRYGKEYYSQTDDWKSTAIDAVKQTNLERYGVDSYAKTPEFHQRSRKVYFYDNTYFDSSWELYYYIYMKDRGYNIKRNTRGLEYFIGDNKHLYFPDFDIDGQLIEIKGNQYIKDDSLYNPYGEKDQSRAIAKDKCLKDNKVKLITSTLIKPAIDYVRNKYGRDFHKNFIITK